jgi:hypothetical protein
MVAFGAQPNCGVSVSALFYFIVDVYD